MWSGCRWWKDGTVAAESSRIVEGVRKMIWFLGIDWIRKLRIEKNGLQEYRAQARFALAGVDGRGG